MLSSPLCLKASKYQYKPAVQERMKLNIPQCTWQYPLCCLRNANACKAPQCFWRKKNIVETNIP